MTFPKALHQVINPGWSIAEAANFSTNTWNDYGTRWERCLPKTKKAKNLVKFSCTDEFECRISIDFTRKQIMLSHIYERFNSDRES